MKPNDTLTEIGNIAFAFAFIVLAAALGYRYIGLPPLIIVGGSGLIGLLAWSATYLKRPTSPEIILPCFLLTVAALEIHMMEEYLTGFGPAMSRLFNITRTERVRLAMAGRNLKAARFQPAPLRQPARSALERARVE